MTVLSNTLHFSSKEDLVDKVLEHVADGFSRTSFTVWAKDNDAQISGIENKNDKLHAIWINRQESKNPHQIANKITNDSSILLKLFKFQREDLQVSTLFILNLKYIAEFMFQTCFENLEGGVGWP